MTKRTKEVATHRLTQREKRLRAIRACIDLLDAAGWMQGHLRAPLELFDLTMEGFRLLEMLQREGPMSVPTAARKRQCTRGNLYFILERLLERGWVRHEFTTLPSVRGKGSRIPKGKRGRKREGRRVGIISVTPSGEKFIELVFPQNAKVVKELMRSLDGREQESLSRLCRKLREGAARKFVSRLTHEEVADHEGWRVTSE